VAFFSVFGFALFYFTQSIDEIRIKQQTIAAVEHQGLATMEAIIQAARNAENITSPAQGASASSVTFDVVTAVDDPAVFDLSGGSIRVTKGAQTTTPLTNSHITASALTVQNLSRPNTPGILRIQFTLQGVSPAGRNEYSYTKTFVGSASLRQP
jgi:hypothetical protein